ncbi:MAG: hypothetical protein GEU80_09050 [Dehalococcoidia bacterium]|nr:hypothetical protein [Dehalococcoidia bacterium]
MRAKLRATDRWGVGQRAAAAAGGIGTLCVLAAALWFASPWIRATVLLLDVVLTPPVRPITWITPEPTVEHLMLADGEAVLVLPGSPHPSPGLVLVLGAQAADPDDPRVVRLLDALARSGLAVLMPRLEELDAGVLGPATVDRLVEAFRALEGDPRVDGARVGFMGLSAGGSVAMVAAADQRIAADTWLVVAVGPYYDATTLVVEVSSQTAAGAQGLEPWTPARITRDTLRSTLLDALPLEERTSIEHDTAPASHAGQVVAALLDGPSREDAEALVRDLPVVLAARIASIDPAARIEGLRAPVYVLHDREDRYIPWRHSVRLAEDYEDTRLELVDLFDHVEPESFDLGILLRDGARVVDLVAAVMAAAR